MNYLQDSILSDGIYYSLDNDISTSLNYLIESKQNNNIVYSIFGLISIAGFFVNRSELWGIFLRDLTLYSKNSFLVQVYII